MYLLKSTELSEAIKICNKRKDNAMVKNIFSSSLRHHQQIKKKLMEDYFQVITINPNLLNINTLPVFQLFESLIQTWE